MVITGKANGIETMRFIVSTNSVHIQFFRIIYNATKASDCFKTLRTLVETMYYIVSAPEYGSHRKGKWY